MSVKPIKAYTNKTWIHFLHFRNVWWHFGYIINQIKHGFGCSITANYSSNTAVRKFLYRCSPILKEISYHCQRCKPRCSRCKPLVRLNTHLDPFAPIQHIKDNLKQLLMGYDTIQFIPIAMQCDSTWFLISHDQ